MSVSTRIHITANYDSALVSLAPSPISLYGTPCTRPQISTKQIIQRRPRPRSSKIFRTPATACGAARSRRWKLWRNRFRPSRQPPLPPPPFLWSARSPATARGSRIVLATIAVLLVALCIARFAQYSASPGSLYTYASMILPPWLGATAAWSLLLAYVATGSSVIGGFYHYRESSAARRYRPRSLRRAAGIDRSPASPCGSRIAT